MALRGENARHLDRHPQWNHLRRGLLVVTLVLCLQPVCSSAPPGGPCGNGLPGNDDDSRCASNQCRSGRCCDPSVGVSCLRCSEVDGFCTQNSCFACAPGEGCTQVGSGFGCCKAEVLFSCFRGCDLNGNCFPLAVPGESCRGNPDCASNKCTGDETGDGVCCRPDVSATCEACSVETGECLRDTILLAIVLFSSIAGCALVTYAAFYWYLYQDTNYLRRLILEERQDSNVVVLNPEDPTQTGNTIEAHVFEPEFEESGELVVEVTSEEERERNEWDIDSEEGDSGQGRNTLARARVISEASQTENVETGIEIGDGRRTSSELDSDAEDDMDAEQKSREEDKSKKVVKKKPEL